MGKGIVVGIDASRCRSGGARTHLLGILINADPAAHGIARIHLWSFQEFVDALPDYPWLVKHSPMALNGNLAPVQLSPIWVRIGMWKALLCYYIPPNYWLITALNSK